MAYHTEIRFRVHQPPLQKMILLGRGARASISVGKEWRDDPSGPRLVRRVNESRRCMVITETTGADTGKTQALDTGKEDKQRDKEPVITIFIFANYVPGEQTRRYFDSLNKDDGYTGPAADESWYTETESNASAEPTLCLRGGCLKLPERQGSKRRLGDDDQLPTLVWWVTGGQVHQKPLTGKQLREWKRKSNGYHKGNKKHNWAQEFAFVMTSGRVGRNTAKPREEDSRGNAGENDGDGGNGENA